MKRRFFVGLLAAASLCLPVQAARPAGLQVDGELLQTAAYVEEGTAYAPLRDLLDALGGWTVWWDGSAARAVSEGASLSAEPGGVLTVNGTRYPCVVDVVDGRTYVPLRLTAEALGGSVRWDPWLDGAAVTSPGAEHDAMDYYWLARIIHAESGGEALEGQIAVGNVVLNRVSSEDFPDSVPGVIFDDENGVQFEPVSNGSVTKEPTELSREAARRALAGENTAGDALYFFAPALSQGTWIDSSRAYRQTIGCHRFYR
ncbi:cell wall hydrolase [uncultured Oscillibacter sp.]|jgi:N-acetylmuramoyl-L-alanine amidase|uniref:cell wall hydrolase n=1 Tax=uncultured Oscillibacter sp. TaxID=876091 RepID=UPI0025F43357|nr:cell wall hydrolase [uncultured Oscillibacter sp.]